MPNVDLAKRGRIMRRSMKLGHCVCDPKRPCPCDVFTSQGICLCAGERPDPADVGEVKLTELVHNAGCASKIAPTDLEGVLARLPAVDDPAVLCGLPAGDDAGIYRLADGRCLVQTVDVMTPCVDDPRTFGRICAANCLSDIYAMGGVPHTALSILAFPSQKLPGQIMYEMLDGAMSVFAEAGVALIGGHSIKDEEIKLGFAITGTIDEAAAVEHGTAAPGDLLVLTKPLGVGVLNFARQVGRDHGDLAAATESMAALNKSAAEAMNEVGVSACTDVTGFGLFGHLISMCRHSGVTAQVHADRLPAFAGAREALAEGVVPGAVERNTEFVADDIGVADDVAEADVQLGFDAQTSGGLLVAVPEAKHQQLLDALAARGVAAATVGRIVERSSGRIAVTRAGENASAAPIKEIQDMPGEHAQPEQAPSSASPCCGPAAAADAGDGKSTAPATLKAWGAMMRSSGAAGALDERTKELITYALVCAARCGPCLQGHHKRALGMGIAPEELAEAMWCAVAIGGAPVKLFYDELMQGADDTGSKGASCCER